ncbi:MAG: universal stress protein [Myxococcales bacterium]|nr:universal stress protein [Myxococcales bacterium]MCB9737243.1 universal stress protein [Deltaproteobacteria bacterium]
MFRKILIPTDFSDCSRRALDVGLRLADTFDAQVICLHAAGDVSQSDFSAELMDHVGESLATAEARVTRAASERLTRFMAEGDSKGLAAKDIEVRVATGAPDARILEVADEIGADLIVIGTHGRTGLRDQILGSTAERVSRRANCSVMTVKPEGYPFLRT